MFHNDATLTNFNTKYGRTFSNMKNDAKMWENIGEKLKKEYGKIISSTDTPIVKAKRYEKALLNVLKEYDVPLNFYRLDTNSGEFDGDWKLLSLDASGNVTENQGL